MKGARSRCQANRWICCEQTDNHKKERGERKKAVETRDLALVARQLGVAYKGWTLLCGAINKNYAHNKFNTVNTRNLVDKVYV